MNSITIKQVLVNHTRDMINLYLSDGLSYTFDVLGVGAISPQNIDGLTLGWIKYDDGTLTIQSEEGPKFTCECTIQYVIKTTVQDVTHYYAGG